MAALTWDIGGAIGDFQITGGDGTWDQLSDVWTADAGATQTAFTNGDDVTFGTSDGLDGNVTLTAGLVANSITIAVGTAYTLTGGSLEVNGTIRANTGSVLIDDADLIINTDLTGFGTTRLNGNITMQGATNFGGTLVAEAGTVIFSSTFSIQGTTRVDDYLQNSGQLFGVEVYGRVFDNYGNTADVSVLSNALIYNQPGAHINNLGGNGVFFVDGIGGARFDNSGTISGHIRGSDMAERFSNSGTVNGNIDMGDGNDTVFASGSINGDLLLGSGDDSLDGNVVNAAVTAEVSLGRGNDEVDGVSYVGGTLYAGVGHDTVMSNAGTYDDHVSGGRGNDLITSGGGSDRLEGGLGADSLNGEAGEDILIGGSGVDRIDGGADADRILGGADRDVLTGGLGADVFIYRSLSELPNGGKLEVINDFTVGTDTIQLSRIDADTTTGGNQAFSFVGTAAFSSTAGELRFEQSAAATFVEMDIDGDGVADGRIRLEGLLTLSAADFIL